MRHEFRIDPEKNCIFKTNYGPLSVAEEIEIISRITADPLFRRGMNAVCDFTKGTADWTLSEIDEFRAFVAKIKPVVGQSRWAIVIPKSENRTTARIFIALHQAFEDTIETKLFDTMADAEQWLRQPVTTGD